MSTHPGEPSSRRLFWVLLLTAGFMVIEFVGGIASNSLALLSDSGHMLSDVVALGLALLAISQVHRPPDVRRSFGYHRLEIVSALANGLLLCAVAAVVAVNAYGRTRTPPEIHSGTMFLVAAAGLVVNLVGIALLRAESGRSLGVRGAFLHVIGDAVGSVGAIGAALVIRATGWTKIDALVSFGIGALILVSGLSLVRESLNILLEGVPRHIRLPEVEMSLRALEGIVDIHDLHVWRIGSSFDTLTVHLVVNDLEEWRVRRETAREMLHRRFGIGHCTIEVEGPGEHVGRNCSEAIRERQDG